MIYRLDSDAFRCGSVEYLKWTHFALQNSIKKLSPFKNFRHHVTQLLITFNLKDISEILYLIYD